MWKLLAIALADGGVPNEALATWRRGIEVAQPRGDRQAVKEMAVLDRRIEKQIVDIRK